MPSQVPTVDQGASPCTADDVLVQLREVLVDVIGADFLLAAEIGTETSFNTDLCLESIQFVVLAEKLRARYGDEVDFVAWLAGMDLDAIIGLRVGHLVEFIVPSVNRARRG